MKYIKAKIFIVITFLVAGYFFSNDFGLIDIEKTAIVTACAIDKENGEYKVTLQIALPSGGGNESQNGKALLDGKGATVAEAIGKTGTVTGWYPSLSFCNLILLGNSLIDEDLSKCLDYFSRSIKIQDSAIVAMTEGSAYTLLEKASPLDNISSFALQKVILKKTGMDGDVLSCDLKEFENNRFSRTKDGYMPLVYQIKEENSDKTKSSESESSGAKPSQSSQTGSNKDKNAFFSASKTKLFKSGVCIGELDEKQTTAGVLIKRSVHDTDLAVKDVTIYGERCDYMLRIINSKFKLKIKLDGDKINVKIVGKVYVKVADETSTDNITSHQPLIILPDSVKEKAEQTLFDDITSLTKKCKDLNFDFFDIDLKLYRLYPNKYEKLSKNMWDKVNFDVNVSVFGQKEYK